MKNGKNIMRDDRGNLSVESKKLIGGLCNYADTLTAFGNTVASSYLRLVPDQEAPTRICWSDLNRSVMIRVPLGWTKMDNLAHVLNAQDKVQFQETMGRQTVELRSPDGSALVHLLLAGITLAAEWGLSNEKSLELVERYYVKGNIFQDEKLLNKLPSLPRSCVDSAQLLLQKRDFYEREKIFPASIIEYVANYLQAENDGNMSHYLANLPDDERLLEMRKIMHKDLHRH
jgi:glutamine synthetase